MAVFAGVAMLSPKFVPSLAGALGLLVSWRGVMGKLAKENARRQSGRTAVTASALMIGLALVALVSILASGLKSTIDSAVNSSFAGNLIIEPTSVSSSQGIPASLAEALSCVPGVATVAPVAFSDARVAGVAGNQPVTGVNGAALSKLYRVGWKYGSAEALSSLGGTGAIVTQSFASSHGFHMGSRLSVLTPSGVHLRLVVRGIASDKAGLLGAITVSRSLVERFFSQPDDGVDFVGYKKATVNALVQPALDRLLREFPQAKSLTAAQFKQQHASQVDSLLALVYVLLALAVLVSLLGLVNTLVLSLYERTRELGLLRAVGLSRRQARQVVRYESVITSLIGAVTGIAVGSVFGLVIARSLGGAGLATSVPLSTLAVLGLVGLVAGVVAAIPPARRASRLDILPALASE